MIKKRIYLAGAMSGLSYEEMNGWRYDIKSAIEDLQQTWVCVNPVNHYYEEDGVIKHYQLDEPGEYSQLEAMRWDLWAVNNADLVLCDMEHQCSLGTAAELAIAYNNNIPIIGVCPKEKRGTLHPWWECMALHICEDYEDAKLFIIEQFINQD